MPADRRDWYRVHYHRWHAGGRLIATWMEIPADDAEHAIRKAESECRRMDRERGRSYCGHFQHATAERKVAA